MPKDIVTDAHLSAICQLIDVISPSTEIADAHREEFLDSDMDGAEFEESAALLWQLKEIVDWETGYFVDWKDTESFVECVTDIAAAWEATLTFGVEDALDPEFLEQVDVPELMARAHAELLPQGLVLWNWATDGDCYSGWITRTDARPVIASIAEVLGVRIREGSLAF